MSAYDDGLDLSLPEIVRGKPRDNGNGSEPQRAAAAEQASEAPRARVANLADVAPEVVKPLWPGWLYCGKLALLAGDPGVGKTYVALDLAARLSNGYVAPDGREMPAGDVVFLTGEDGLADTIRPRLDRAGADVSRVWALCGVREEGDAADRTFNLSRDVPVFEEVIREHAARLVIIDPADSFLPGVDTHRNADLRSVLAPFTGMLERTGCAALFVNHLNKDASSVNALYRVTGSLAWVAVARSVMGVMSDPEDEERERRLFLSIKNNLQRKPAGLGYRISDQGVSWDRDPVNVDAATAFTTKRGDSDLMARAKECLRNELAGGKRVPQTLVEEAAEAADISLQTLKRAKRALGVESVREGFGPGALWFWQLTEESPRER